MSAAFRARAAALIVAIAAGLASGGARADEQGDVDKGKNAYLTRQYDEADMRFAAMLDPKVGTVHDPVLVTQAYMLWGAVKVAKKQPQEASALFEQLLLKDPHYEPDPLSFPTEVLDAFSDTKNRIRQKLNQAAQEAARRDAERRAREEQERRRQVARLALLERLASEEKITEEHPRWINYVPFGAGQFQNGNTTLGWIFAGAEAAFLLAGTAMVPFYYSERTAANAALTEQSGCNPPAGATSTQCYSTRDQQVHADRANTLQALNLAFYGAFAVTAIAGIVQANAKWEPRVVVIKKRTLPEPVVTTTGARGRTTGATIGLRLAF